MLLWSEVNRARWLTNSRKRWQRFRIVMSSMAQKRATAKTSTIDRAASVSRTVLDNLWPVTGRSSAISTNDASATSEWRVIRSGHSMLSGIIHLSSQIFFLSPLTLTLRDPLECKVADGTNVVSAEKKRWLTQSNK